jgi:hypothetical protein
MATIKAIRNDGDYNAALARIDALMDAEPGTPEGDELDVLTDLVEHFEEKDVPLGLATCETCNNLSRTFMLLGPLGGVPRGALDANLCGIYATGATRGLFVKLAKTAVMRTFTIAAAFLVFSMVPSVTTARAQERLVHNRDKHPTALMSAIQKVLGNVSVVCDARRLLIPGQGSTILASLDSSGRHFCNELVILHGNVIVQRFDAWWVDDLSTVIRDLDHNGGLELVINQAYSPYEGATACMSVFPTVYKCQGETCIEASAQFQGHYTDYVDRLERELADLENRRLEQDVERLPCVRMEIDKAHRLLGADPTAGFALAEEWMKSKDARLRAKAVVVFSDIGDEASRQRLKVLQRDPDASVAEFAKGRSQ